MLLLHWIRIYGYDNIGFASSQSLVAKYHLDTIMVRGYADARDETECYSSGGLKLQKRVWDACKRLSVVIYSYNVIKRQLSVINEGSRDW